MVTRAERARARRDAVSQARQSSWRAGRNETTVQARRAVDEDRRQVRTVTTPARRRRRVRKPRVKVPRFATTRRRGRRARRSRRDLTAPGLLYWITAALLVLVVVVVQVLGWGLVAFLSIAASAVAGTIATRQEVRYGSARVHRSRPAGGAKRGTPGSRGGRASGTGGRRRSVCSAACRHSSSSREKCDCPCEGKTHGVRQGTA